MSKKKYAFRRAGELSTVTLVLIVLFASLAQAQEDGAEIWSVDVLHHPYDLTTISDVTGDSVPDVIVGTLGDVVLCISGYDGLSGSDGSFWWTFPTNGTVWSVCGVGDIDDDGEEDVAVGTANNEVHCVAGGSLTGEAAELWMVPTSGDVWTVCSLNDINGDGRAEVVAGTGNDKVLCLSGYDGDELWRFGARSDVWTVSVCPDVNDDGADEIVAGSADDNLYLISGADGTLLWKYSTAGDVWTTTYLDDIDGDGAAEVVAGTANDEVVCISGGSVASGERLWRFRAGSDVRALEVMPDVTGDGVWDVIAGSADDSIYVLDGLLGTQAWTELVGSETFSATWLRDFTGDGVPEIAYGTEASSVGCSSGDGSGALWVYPLEYPGNIEKIVRLPDITGDGVEEIAAISSFGIVTCLSGVGLVDPIVNWPPEIDPIGDRRVTEGDALEFVVSAADPNDDNVVFTAEGVPAGATFTDNGDGTAGFAWQTTFDDAGTYTVTFHVEDDGTPPLADARTITISVTDDPLPKIHSVEPGLGTTGGGTRVAVTGLNFQPDATVLFDGEPATLIDVSLVEIVCETPAHAAGAVDVTVTQSGGTHTLESVYVYTASDIEMLVVAPMSMQGDEVGIKINLANAGEARAALLDFVILFDPAFLIPVEDVEPEVEGHQIDIDGAAAVETGMAVISNVVEEGRVEVEATGANAAGIENGTICILLFVVPPNAPSRTCSLVDLAVPRAETRSEDVLVVGIADADICVAMTDINSDGTVTAIDVQLTINAILGLDISFDAPDANGDGQVNASDLQQVINAALGIPGGG